jgi:glycine cleavage system H protein
MTVGPTRYYKRSRFVTHLPTDRFYTPSHYWLQRQGADDWTIGFTRFATRMLGDIVELDFTVAADGALALGQNIGTVEGFKAVSELYSVVTGTFIERNAALDRDITLIESDPYGRGWLFRARGAPDPQHLDVEGYTGLLDTTIDAMLASRHDLAGDDE